MFKRIIDFHLDSWKNDPYRKPLLLRGARQVGKTYAVRRLGAQFKSFVEVNFERLEEAPAIFEKDLSPERIVRASTSWIPGRFMPQFLWLMIAKKRRWPAWWNDFFDASSLPNCLVAVAKRNV